MQKKSSLRFAKTRPHREWPVSKRNIGLARAGTITNLWVEGPVFFDTFTEDCRAEFLGIGENENG